MKRRGLACAVRAKGSITNRTAIMRDAVSPGGAVSYLHDERILKKWEKLGLVYKSYDYHDGTWSKYYATEKGREAFVRNKLP